ncbi:MAG: hypothetical protein VYD71_02855 [Bacteroidota bacterium]|nr:hypothetical protein [Bacteroidota bacterium]
MIKKSIIFVILFAFFSLQIKSQESNDWSFSFGIGSTQFFGDLDMGKDLGSAFSLQLNKDFEYNYDLQIEFIMGDMNGEKLFSGVCENPYHTESGVQLMHEMQGEIFDAEFMEFDINLLVNFSSLFDRKRSSQNYQSQSFSKNMNLNFLAKVGVGLNMFRTKRTELISGDFINSYGYKWMWENDFEHAGSVKESWKNTIVEPSFVLGIVIEHQLSKGKKLIFSIVNRIGGSDKWDAKVSNKDDMFTIYSLGTTIKLSK